MLSGLIKVILNEFKRVVAAKMPHGRLMVNIINKFNV
jgi:hypothetical protein